MPNPENLIGKGFDNFPEHINRKGRKGKSILTMIRKKLYDENSEMIFKGVEEIDEAGNETGRKVNVKIKLKNAEALVMHFNRQIFKNDKLLIWLMEQESGKAIQKIEDVTHREELTEEELKRELKRIDDAIKSSK